MKPLILAEKTTFSGCYQSLYPYLWDIPLPLPHLTFIVTELLVVTQNYIAIPAFPCTLPSTMNGHSNLSTWKANTFLNVTDPVSKLLL